MERIVQAIQVDSKNIADIFKLPCVKGIEKIDLGPTFKVRVKTYKASVDAIETDWICQFSDGKWRVLIDAIYAAYMIYIQECVDKS